mgnify:CR=1 FL=1
MTALTKAEKAVCDLAVKRWKEISQWAPENKVALAYVNAASGSATMRKLMTAISKLSAERAKGRKP